jgi:glutathione S-transferase
LDELNEPYEEVENIGILGVVLFGRLVPVLHIPKNKTSISNSRDIVRFLYSKYVLEDRAKFLKPIGGLAVQLEDSFEKLGVHARKWIYFNILYACGKQGRELTLRGWGLYQPHIQLWQRRVLPILYPALKIFVAKPLGIHERGCRQAVVEIDKIFDVVDALLADGRMYLLDTQNKSYLDMYLACMAALILLPPEYGGGRIVARSRILPDELPPDARKDVARWRARPTGQFVMRMFSRERRPAGL